MGKPPVKGKGEGAPAKRPMDSAPTPPIAPQAGQSKSLFTQAGPISLESSKRGVLTLGGIGSSTKSLPPTSSGYSQPAQMPSSPLTPTEMRPSPPITEPMQRGPILSSSGTSWSHTHWTPRIDSTAHVDAHAIVIGNVRIGPGVFVSAGTIIRGENEEPIYIGEGCFLQENVVIRDLPSRMGGQIDKKRLVEVNGEMYSVYIGKKVAICAQSQIHGPARLEDGVYIGMQALIFWASIGEGAVVEPACLVMNASVPPRVFVPAGLTITSQKPVKDLPPITPQYRFYGIGEETASAGQEFISSAK